MWLPKDTMTKEKILEYVAKKRHDYTENGCGGCEYQWKLGETFDGVTVICGLCMIRLASKGEHVLRCGDCKALD